MELSIVTTLYCSAPYLKEFYARMCAAAKRVTDRYEIIFVNDGSPDDALKIAAGLHEKDERVTVIDLSRNFGHHKAMMTGLTHAKGKRVFLIDCDLEEEPELLVEFSEAFGRLGADVVYGVQKERKESFFSRMMAGLFYRMFDVLSSYPVPHHLMTVRLMSKEYVSALVEHKDREVFISGLWAVTGFRQEPLAVSKHSKGESSYSFDKKISVFVNAVTSFSNKPLAFIFYLGTVIMLLSGAAAAYLMVRRIFFGVLLAGWPSLIVSVWLLGGLTIFCLGIIGIYLSKIFMETKQRPYTVIRKIYRHAEEEKK